MKFKVKDTLTGVCATERLFSVQAYTDVSSGSRGWISARPSPLVVSAPAAG